MSFSSDAKLELAHLLPTKRCCALAELGAILRVEGPALPRGRSDFSVAMGSGAAARKVYLLLKAAGFDGRTEVQRRSGHGQRRAYLVQGVDRFDRLVEEVERALGGDLDGPSFPAKDCCRRSYLRAAFMCRGSLSAPSKTYHLEVTVDRADAARSVADCLRAFDVPAKIAVRKRSHVVYLKESEGIVEALSLMGAHGALLQFENVRIVKGMRNHVNRLVNCETANVDKTVAAAAAQLDAIRALERGRGLDALPKALREVARLRLEHPYASLRELGELLSPRVSKSGISYRMRRIESLARKAREEWAEKGRRTTE